MGSNYAIASDLIWPISNLSDAHIMSPKLIENIVEALDAKDSEISALKEKLAEAEKALRSYGRHGDDCYIRNFEFDCKCGLDKSLAQTESGK